MRVCSKCGERNEDWMDICQRCGHSIVNADIDNYSENNYQPSSNYITPKEDKSYGFDEEESNDSGSTGGKGFFTENMDLKIILVILIIILVVLILYATGTLK